jgi:branched-chain amino acid transport system permease protein
MDTIFFIEQLFNGLGYGLILFLLAAGLTLVFGIMDTLNLAHGSLFMVGGYVAATVHTRSGSFTLAIAVAVLVTVLAAMLLEVLLVRRLYRRDHLSQVLVTFGIILILDDAVRAAWGPTPIRAPTPTALQGALQLMPGLPYPSYRVLILAAGLAVAAGLYVLVKHTRIGIAVRAGASNRRMAEFMGVRVDRVFSIVFALGAALAALAGALIGPIASVEVGMGEAIMIPALVVIVIGGIGSVRGAFAASLLVGLVDTAGRAFLPLIFRAVLPSSIATDLGAAVASIGMYIVMAVVLVVKPTGLFPARA